MMMFVEGHWESIDTLQDISRIIREYYNENLANRLDDMIPDSDNLEDELEELEGLRSIIDEIRGLVL